MNDRKLEAGKLLQAFDQFSIEAHLKIVLAPGRLVTPEIEQQVRDLKPELQMLIAQREIGAEPDSETPTARACWRCHARYEQPSALELFEDIAHDLACLAWPAQRIERLRDELNPDERLIGLGHGAITVKNASTGAVRELSRWDA